MGRKCCVPRCNTGYNSNKEKISLFKIPVNKLEEWSRTIPRKDRKLTTRDHVCVKHFKDDEIITEIKTDAYSVSLYYIDFLITSNGSLNFKYKLLYPKLKPDAVPTIFLGCTKYLSSTPKKRRVLNRNQPTVNTETIYLKQEHLGEDHLISSEKGKIIDHCSWS